MTATARPFVRYFAQASAWAPKVGDVDEHRLVLDVVDRDAEVADASVVVELLDHGVSREVSDQGDLVNRGC